MSIQPKASVKALFLDGSEPNGTAFQNWIDSCAFLNTDNSVTLNSLRLPVSTAPASAASGYKTLFFYSTNSNNLYCINSAGVISAIAPTQYITVPLYPTYRVGESQVLLLIKKAIKIKSVRVYAEVIGGDESVDIYVLGKPVGGAALTICGAQTITIPATQDAIEGLTLTTTSIPADHAIICVAENYTGSFLNGVITIEYEEVG